VPEITGEKKLITWNYTTRVEREDITTTWRNEIKRVIDNFRDWCRLPVKNLYTTESTIF
jgi:hypothetical protein